MQVFEEHKILLGCQREDRKAQQALFQHYADKLLGLCIRYVKDKEIAEEIMIIGFTKVFEKIGTYRGEGSFEGWIKRLMVNECLMYLRKQQRLGYTSDIDEINQAETAVQPETDLEVNELLNMIHELPEGYKTVFNMYAIEGYSHKEIAESLNITEGTSKSQLSKARSFLQKLIIKQEQLP